MPAAFAVVHADDQAYGGVEAARDQRGRHVGLVVAVGEGEGRGPFDSGGPEGLFVGAGGDEEFDRRARVTVESGDLGAVFVAAGGQDDGDRFAAHRVEFDGEAAGETVVAADHHVLGALPDGHAEVDG